MNRLSILNNKFTKLSGNLRLWRKLFERTYAIGWAIAPLVIIAGLWLWQVLGQFAIGLIGQSSSFTVWSLWWLQRAIWLNYDWMITDYVATPFQQNLLLFLSPIGSLIYAGLRGLQFNAPLAFNLLYVIAILFTGWSMFAYLGYCQVPRFWASFCAVLWAFSPVMTYQLFQGRPDLMALGWIPLGCWAWDVMRTTPHPNRLGWRLALIGLGAIFTSVQLAISALVVWLPYIAIGLFRSVPGDRRWLFNSVLWQTLVVLAVIMVYPLPGILKTWASLAPESQAITLPAGIWQWSAGIILMVILWGGLMGLVGLNWRMVTSNRISSGTLIEPINEVLSWASITSVTLVLGCVAATGWLLDLRSWFTPVDWFASASMGWCWLVAVCLPVCWKTKQRQGQAFRVVLPFIPVGILILAIVLQPAPPTIPWNDSTAYTAIGQEGGDYAVLEVPFGLKSLSSEQTLGTGATLQQYAVEHHKRSLSGMLTRDGLEVFQHYTDSPLFRLLAGEPVIPSPEIAADLKKTIQQEQIGYLVVHPDQLPLAQRTLIFNFLNAQPQNLCKVFTDSVTVVYRTSWHPFGCTRKLGSLPTAATPVLEAVS
ncbi:hypothetical protein ACN4EK_16055 [Pantanalinema rosaneae CENA516]|uniref:hypothetical protein n=1 Tax=Pantanalinema rosaneae TaxID=1620701 RepID=UPI003D6F6DA4